MIQKRIGKSVVAVLLSVIMIMASFPLSAFAVEAEDAEVFTITVLDSDNVKLDGATVSYEIKVNNVSTNSGTVTTVDGVAEITEIAGLAENINGSDEVLISYTVEKEDYTKQISEMVIDSVSGNINVVLIKENATPETVTITVNKTGEGTVELNGEEESSYTFNKGEVVTLTVTAGKNSVIKSLTFDQTTLEVRNVSSYTVDLTLDNTAEIDVVFVKEFTVSSSAQKGGSIFLNNSDLNSVTVEDGTNVKFSVVPSEGYQISNVTVNGSSCSIADVYNFSDEITVTENITISASFIKEYKVTVSINNENGKVELDDSVVQITESTPDGIGSVVVRKDSTVSIVAIPAENHRVAKVVKNGKETLFDKNDKSFEEKVKNENVSYEIVFSPNMYSVTVKDCENGTAELKNSGLVEYGSDNELTITPDKGYRIASVIINGTEVNKDYLASSGDVIEKINNESTVLRISKITQDTEIEVLFSDVEKVDISTVTFNSDDAIRVSEDSTQYVFANDTVVKLETKANGLMVNNDTTVQAYKTNSHEFTETVIVESLKIYKYADENDVFGAWYDVTLEAPIELIIDKTAPTVTLTPDRPNVFGYYKSNVSVDIVASDPDVFSGIKSVKYVIGYIDEDGNVVKPQDMIEITDLYGEAESKTANISVNAAENNRKDNLVFVEVVDLAGNVYTNDAEPLKLNINTTVPKICVMFDGTPHQDAYSEGEYLYYNSQRKAVITIEDRIDTFNPDEVKIEIEATDADNNTIDVDIHGMLGKWKLVGLNKHQIELTFDDSAIYEWNISYTNKAGINNLGVESNEGQSPFKFAVDKDAPTGEIETEGTVWHDIVSTLTFGIWSKKQFTAFAKGEDRISPVYPVVYYKSATKLDRATLVKAYDDGLFVNTPYIVDSDEEFIIYSRIMDYAGNAIYVSTDGLIVDLTTSTVELTPEEPNEYGLYNDDVNVEIYVSEIKNGNTYSGIKSIEYWVVCDGIETQRLTLFDFSVVKEDNGESTIRTIDWSTGKELVSQSTGKVPTKDQLKTDWRGNIIVDAEKNNGCQTEVYVKTVDNAGNEKTEKIKLDIDVVAPAIELTYDNNNGNRYVDEEWYFDNNRTATITIYERHFDADEATKSIKIAAETKGTPIEIALEDLIIGQGWKESIDLENPDMNKYTLELMFADDATYSISEIVYTDRAGNVNSKPVDTKNSVSPYDFTVDKTKPQGSVTLNENSWNKIVKILTFGFFSNIEISVKANAYDETSPVDIYYYESTSNYALTEDDLDAIGDGWKEFNPYVIEDNRKVAVYLKIIDAAGNWIYVSSDGYIIDNMAPEFETIPLETNKFGDYYNGNVEVQITVNDGIGEVVDDVIPYSGIKKIEYSVASDGIETKPWTTLYDFDYIRAEGDNSNGGSLKITDWSTGEAVVTEIANSNVPTYDMLKQTWEGTIVIDAEQNNSCHVKVFVRVTDNAGNISNNIDNPLTLDIDITQPEIEITYDNNNDNNGNGYFNANRTATVKVYERTHHFNAQKFVDSVEISAFDAKNNPVAINKYEMFGEWTHEENPENRERDVHITTISYTVDANYTFAILTPAAETTEVKDGYMDEAGNISKTPNTFDSVAPYKFTVDKTAPFGTVTGTSREGRVTEWDKLINDLTFGFWSAQGIAITNTADDATSPIASVSYYKTADTTALTVDTLKTITDWTPFAEFEVEPNEQFTVYISIYDMAGNVTYISTDGMIVDNVEPRVEGLAPNISIQPSESGIYNGDVKIDIDIVDPEVENTYSGIKTISYKVYNMGIETQSGTLFAFEKENPKHSDLLQNWSGQITVDSTANNSNDVKIEVFAEDNALNSVKSDIAVQIDITPPTIDVEYDNNDPDSGMYYKETRTATVTITERNFNEEDVVITVQRDGSEYTVSPVWSTSAGTGNGDGTKHIAKIEYYEDGDYTFDMSYTDLADNPADGVSFAAGTANSNEFTVDLTLPVISVSYDNNSAQNGKYFKASRTATITIIEHNFDPNRVELVQDASIDGSSISSPGISAWNSSGDTHTAKITYATDGDYLFDIKATDLAGNISEDANYGASVAANDFTVDTTITKPVISGVSNGKSYKAEVSPTVTATDINYNGGRIQLLRTRKGEKNVDVTAELMTRFEETASGGFARSQSFKKIAENDGIYTLTATYSDLAGNEATERVVFTVNRFGSVYTYDDYLISIQDAYIQSVSKPLVITEYNPDRLVGGSLNVEITRNGSPVEDIKYEVSPVINAQVTIGESGWYQYEYTIAKSNFAEDGIYKLTISSEDEVGNKPETSNFDGYDVMFRVDTTPPEITNIKGLEEDIVNADSLSFEYEIFDAIGIKNVTVYVNDQAVQTFTDFEDLIKFKSSWTLQEGSDQRIKIVIEDLAGNILDTSTDEFIPAFGFNDKVTVSTNFLVRWYANKPLFWGSIGGTAALGLAIILLVVLKKKKSSN